MYNFIKITARILLGDDMKKTLVIGTGNELFGYDSVGLNILKKLSDYNLPENIETLYIGTNCFYLTKEVDEYERIIVIDAIITSGEIGNLYYIPADKLQLQNRPLSIHDITWLEILKILGVLHKTYVFAIEINTLKPGLKLTPVLKKKLNFYTEKLYNLIISD
ncbi:MAG: hydrogenase maturation protease [Clostridia bacterium]|jgi:hydrogenase maturation protease|nr:hydrogenase maturation protease [Clostridia bacterium]MDN5323308.1 hydrogenase maturation protease [Clostridia bacterium]